MRYELRISAVFSAAHAIVIRGEREPVHGHDWHVEAVVGSDGLDEDGLVCDFHALEASLAEVIASFRNADLNASPPFDRVNPTAERVAEHIAQRLAQNLPTDVELSQVSVTEAPGCVAVYRAH